MNAKRLPSFDELLSDLESSYGLISLGKNDDEASNVLYAFSEKSNPLKKSHVLKQLGKNSIERKTYTVFLPKLTFQFETLELPKLIQVYELPEFDYLLMPYYHGDRFNFNTSDIELTKGMVGIIKDLSKINVEGIIPGGSIFDYEGVFSCPTARGTKKLGRWHRAPTKCSGRGCARWDQHRHP